MLTFIVALVPRFGDYCFPGGSLPLDELSTGDSHYSYFNLQLPDVHGHTLTQLSQPPSCSFSFFVFPPNALYNFLLYYLSLPTTRRAGILSFLFLCLQCLDASPVHKYLQCLGHTSFSINIEKGVMNNLELLCEITEQTAGERKMYPHTEDTHARDSGQRDCHSLSLYFQPVRPLQVT